MENNTKAPKIVTVEDLIKDYRDFLNFAEDNPTKVNPEISLESIGQLCEALSKRDWKRAHELNELVTLAKLKLRISQYEEAGMTRLAAIETLENQNKTILNLHPANLDEEAADFVKKGLDYTTETLAFFKDNIDSL